MFEPCCVVAVLEYGPVMGTRRFLTGSAIGVVDQALLSALNFGVGLAFIRVSSKSEFALYTLMATALLLFQSIQNAIINAPAATLISAAPTPGDRMAALAAARHLQAWMLVVVVSISAMAAVVSALGDHRSWAALIAAACVCALGVLSREYARAMHYLEGNPLRALKSDALYVALALTGGGLLIAQDLVSATHVLVVVGVAALAAQQLDRSHRLLPLFKAWRSAKVSRASLLEVWQCARWALPSVLNTWLYANAFLYIVGIWMSQAAVAELSAARLLGVPLSLVMAGWSSAFRPRAGQWLATGQADKVHRLALRSVGGFLAIGSMYAVLLWLALPIIEKHVLGANYQESIVLIWPWLILATANNLRGVGQVAMLACKTSFKMLFGYGCVALAVALPAVALASGLGSQMGVLGALIFAELILAALIWRLGWPQVRGQTTGQGSA